jgi:response regulator RpfG family c-di-GMP phosphodiesterase
MKILVADNLFEIRLLLSLMLQTSIDAKIDEAEDGEQALQLINQNGPYDLVISDYDMPNKNGFEFYNELRHFYPSTPFLLVSSDAESYLKEFKNLQNFSYIQKPFDRKSLFDSIHKLLGTKNIEKQTTPYVSIPLQTIYYLKSINYPLYVKISDDKFLKVLHPGALFSAEEKNRFLQKNIDQLYIEQDHLIDFMHYFRKHVFSKISWDEIDTKEITSLLSQDLTLINKSTKKFGWDSSLVMVALENIEKALFLLEKNPNFASLIKSFNPTKNMQLGSHSILLCIGTTALLKKLGWTNNFEIQKLTFASLLHDMDLDEETFVNTITLLANTEIDISSTEPEIQKIINHPLNSAKIVADWPLCPPDVDTIIRQHHENPYSKGFPKKLNANDIFPLSAVFIIVEDLIYNCSENFNTNPLTYLTSKKDYYSIGKFKKIYEAFIQTLS